MLEEQLSLEEDEPSMVEDQLMLVEDRQKWRAKKWTRSK